MAVNGIEIKVGQRWRTRDGNIVTVEDVYPDPSLSIYPVAARLETNGHRKAFTDAGKLRFEVVSQLDFLELIADDTAPRGSFINNDPVIVQPAGDTTQATTFGPLKITSTDETFKWRPWNGGECPVPNGTFVNVILRDGHEMGCVEAGAMRWVHDEEGSFSDIMTFRLLTSDEIAASEVHIEPAATPGQGVEDRTNPKDIIGDKKLALHLLSPIAEAHWAVAHYAGMLKYGVWNWRMAGVRGSIYTSAMRRHLAGYISGEEFDPVDGSHHLGNIMACAAILLEARAFGKLTDDRPPSFSHRPTYEWAEERIAALKQQYADKNPKHYSIADRAPAADTEGGEA